MLAMVLHVVMFVLKLLKHLDCSVLKNYKNIHNLVGENYFIFSHITLPKLFDN